MGQIGVYRANSDLSKKFATWNQGRLQIANNHISISGAKYYSGNRKFGFGPIKQDRPLIGLSAHSSSITQASRRIVGKLSSTRAAATSVAFSSRGFRRRIRTASIVGGFFRRTGSGARFPPPAGQKFVAFLCGERCQELVSCWIEFAHAASVSGEP